jgi:hypothetical protein
MSFHVSWDFFEQLSLESGGAGEGQICLPRPSATYLAVMPKAKMLVHLVSPDVGLHKENLSQRRCLPKIVAYGRRTFFRRFTTMTVLKFGNS